MEPPKIIGIRIDAGKFSYTLNVDRPDVFAYTRSDLAQAATKEAKVLRELLICMASEDMVDDLPLDIVDWLAEIDRILAGEEAQVVFLCESCPGKYWRCRLCEILKG